MRISTHNLFKIGKGIWGVLITIATIWIGYSQYTLNRKTIRPSLAIEVLPGSDEFINLHGALSHTIQIKNSGAVSAKEVKIHVVTKQDGLTLHADRDMPVGDMVTQEQASISIHVDPDRFNMKKEEYGKVIEEIDLSYKSELEGVLCTEQFEYSATMIYRPRQNIWSFHPQVSPEERVVCL